MPPQNNKPRTTQNSKTNRTTTTTQTRNKTTFRNIWKGRMMLANSNLTKRRNERTTPLRVITPRQNIKPTICNHNYSSKPPYASKMSHPSSNFHCFFRQSDNFSKSLRGTLSIRAPCPRTQTHNRTLDIESLQTIEGGKKAPPPTSDNTTNKRISQKQTVQSVITIRNVARRPPTAF